MAASAFSPALFSFLRELRENNDRDWFAANKPRYERDVRDPSLRFIGDFATRLAKIAPRLVADARPVGGSMFRIYRDTRFSHDKSPYKIHIGILEDLKRTDFVTSLRFTDREICAPSFLTDFTAACKKMSPLVKFVSNAMGLEW